MGDVALRPPLPVPDIELRPDPLGAPQRDPCRIVGIPSGVVADQIEEGLDVAVLDHEASVHVGLARPFHRVRRDPPGRDAIHETDGHRHSDRACVAVTPHAALCCR